MVPLANVRITTARPAFNNSTNATSAPQVYLQDVLAAIVPMRAKDYVALPESAVTSQYIARVDSGTDIATGDRIVKITLLDGVTPWPGDTSALDGSDPTSQWWVLFHQEQAPLLFPSRLLYLGRETASGPFQSPVRY